MKNKSYLGVSAINGFTYNATIFTFLGSTPSAPVIESSLILTSAQVEETFTFVPIFVGLIALVSLVPAAFIAVRKVRRFQSVAGDVSRLTAEADGLYELGRMKGDNEALREAISLLREAGRRQERDRVSLDWAGTQNKVVSRTWWKWEGGVISG